MASQVLSMARKPKRNDEVVKVDAEVLRMARIVSAIESIPLAELVTEYLRPIVAKKLEEYARKGFDMKNPPRRGQS